MPFLLLRAFISFLMLLGTVGLHGQDNLPVFRWKATPDERLDIVSAPVIDRDGTAHVTTPSEMAPGIPVSNGHSWFRIHRDGSLAGSGLFINAVPPPAVGPDNKVYLTTWNAVSSGVWVFSTTGAVLEAFGVPARYPITIDDDAMIYSAGSTPLQTTITALWPDRSRRYELKHAGWVPNVSAGVVDASGAFYLGENLFGASTIIKINADGTLAWRTVLAPGPGHLALGRNALYIAFYNWLTRIESSGTIGWTVNLTNYITSPLVVGEDDTVYFGLADSKFVGISSNGIRNLQYPVAGQVLGGAAIANDGSIFWGTTSNLLYRLQPEKSHVWLWNTGSPIVHSLALDADGRLYVPTAAHLLAFDTGTAPARSWSMDRANARRTASLPYELGEELPVPSNATATSGDQFVTLTWDSTPGALGYRVSRATSNDFALAILLATNITGRTNFVDRDVLPNLTNYYWVQANRFTSVSEPGPGTVGYRRPIRPGDLLWKVSFGQRIYSDPVVDDGRGIVYVSIGTSVLEITDGKIIGLDRTGQEVSRVADRKLATHLALSEAGGIYAVFGFFPWEFFPVSRLCAVGFRCYDALGFSSGAELGVPAVVPNEMLIYVRENILKSVDATSGTLRWSVPLPGVTTNAPAVATDGTVYLGAAKSLSAITQSGQVKWSVSTETDVDSGCAIGPDGTIYAKAGTNMYAFIAAGQLRWRFSAPNGDWLLPPVVSGANHVYLASSSALFSLGASGEIRWSQGLDTLAVGIALGGEAIYVYTATNITCYTAEGAVKWRVPGIYYRMTIGGDGTIYLADFNSVYAVAGEGPNSLWSWPMYGHDPRHTFRQPIQTITLPRFDHQGFSAEVIFETATLVAVQTSTNLVNWAPLVYLPGGNRAYRFSDPRTNSGQRFYRAIAP